MVTKDREKILYGEAIREATSQCMVKDDSIIVLGEGVNDPAGMWGSTLDLYKEFGDSRVFDVPNSENGFTGMAIGAALNGLRPIIVHQRNEFLLLAMDQIVNQAAKWAYMFDGKGHVPIIVRAVVGRGWGQGAQHAQSLQSLFMHFPGLKVVMPSNAYDAKGLLTSALLRESGPVVFIEHRWLYKKACAVPEEMYEVPIGKAKVVRGGNDATIVSISQSLYDSLKAAEILSTFGINVEVIDAVTTRPLDVETIANSVKKTGKLVAVDTSWKMCSFASEVCASIAEDENAFKYLEAPVKRIACAEVPIPTAYALESLFYPNSKDIVTAILQMLKKEVGDLEKVLENEDYFTKKNFSGSF
ncbi:alpha-ketoacid dehydrogenase subunit beta [Patescibacteria group bacterium]|nr:alpha-ketoacid dehydrogenase subunit beta [Patescibacteria group bacterium]